MICALFRPQEVPTYIAYVKKMYRYLVKLKTEIYSAIDSAEYTEGDNGMLYKSYQSKRDDIKKLN